MIQKKEIMIEIEVRRVQKEGSNKIIHPNIDLRDMINIEITEIIIEITIGIIEVEMI